MSANSPDMFDSMEIDNVSFEPQDKVPMNELSSEQINCLDPFRDDPLIEELKPPILKAYLDQVGEDRIESGDKDSPGLEPCDFCLCGNCTKMRTLDESVCCCKLVKGNVQFISCVLGNDIIDMILNPQILEITLRNIWSSGAYDESVADKTLSKKNYRYAAYRNLFFFLFKKNEKKKDYREALPSCLVGRVRKEFPEDSDDLYVGFKKVRQDRPHHSGRVKPFPTLPSCSRVHLPVPEGEREGEELAEVKEGEEGYNSEDEYSHVGHILTKEEWVEKDIRFERIMGRKGYKIKSMGEDGACLFRAVADQLYEDQEMHHHVRAQCMNYIERNADYYSHYITEDFEEYLNRKRTPQVYGNHLEIQALSEIYKRSIHIYCYSAEPINIFQHLYQTDSQMTIPIRLCYHRAGHYNSLVDPNNASFGVGLGLPGLKPGMADMNMTTPSLSRR